MNPSDVLVLVTYETEPSPPGAPLSGVVDQSRWKVVEHRVGTVPFTHLDLLFVEDGASWRGLEERFPGSRQALICEVVAAPATTETTGTLFFNPYSPRDDAEERGFHEFLRDVDNPFQNTLPEMVNYSNWRVLEAFAGPLDFTEFDIQYVDGRAGADALLANEDKKRFGRGWVERWGRNPGGELSDNYRKCLCEQVR